MKKTLTTILLLALLALFTTAYADTSADTIFEWIDGAIGEGEVITNVELNERTLSVVVDLSQVDELYPGFTIDLATDRASSITDDLLDHPDFDAEWDSINIIFENIGYFSFTKDDIETNEYDMRYMNVYDDDYNSRIVVDGEAPTAAAESGAGNTAIETMVRDRISEYYRDTDIDSISINADLGTDDPDDYIVLVNLTWNVMNRGSTSKEMLKMYSDDLAASVYQSGLNVQEIAIFWTVPYLSNANAKRAYERQTDGMYLTDEVWAAAFE